MDLLLFGVVLRIYSLLQLLKGMDVHYEFRLATRENMQKGCLVFRMITLCLVLLE